MPYTNDVSNFVLKAEIERRRYNLKKIDIVFITNDTYPTFPNMQSYINKDNYKYLIYNLSVEYTRLFPTIGSFMVLDNRNQAIEYIKAIKKQYKTLYPYDYNPVKPFERIMPYMDRSMSFYLTDYYKYAQKDNSINFLSPPKDQVVLARKWIKKNIYPKIPVIITLREAKEATLRDSKIEQWQQLVSSYNDDEKYLFVILRDYYGLYEEDVIVGNNVVYCNEAVLSLSFRAALYQESTLSLFVANGSGMLAWYNKNVNYLMFALGTQENACSSVKSNKEKLNLNHEDDWHGATKYQKLIYKDDTYPILKKELTQMLKILDNDNNLFPKFYDKEFQEKSININEFKKEVYKEDSEMSKRIHLDYYIYTFKIIDIFKKIFNIDSYKSLNDIKITSSTKILFYGAGTITKNLIPKYKNNIVGIVDKNFNNLKNKKMDNISIYPIEEMANIEYDYIFISPIDREHTIIKELKNLFIIKNKIFLINTSTTIHI
ncbi:MAG: hypothetical protein U9N02_09425 [Campylobacterota bacterium]|nr:hypothetical protein [Campylobacterota bacterium]